MKTLLLVPALSPIDEGSHGQGAAIRDYAQSLQNEGYQVTVVIPLGRGASLERAGLARRLEKVTVDGKELIIHEGTMEGGKIKLIAIGSDSGSLPDPTHSLRAALSLSIEVESIQVWPKTQSALNWAKTLASPPIAIAHVSEPKTGHPFSADGLDNASLLILPSASSAQRLRKAKDNKLSPFADKLFGVVPGYDMREWNPSRDSLLSKRLDPPTLALKEENKKALRAELGLADADVPLIGVVSRVAGMQRAVGDEILALGVQIVGIDAGPVVSSLASRAPTQVACPEPASKREQRQLRHRILAAADFVIMPQVRSASSQLYPARYGASLIARDRGEFAERLINFDPRSLTGSGFLYAEDHQLSSAVNRALQAWKAGEDTRNALIERSVALDLGWSTTALRLTEWIATLSSAPAS